MEDPRIDLVRDALKSEAERRRAVADKVIKEPEYGVGAEEIVGLQRTAILMEEIAEGEIHLGRCPSLTAVNGAAGSDVDVIVDATAYLQSNAKDDSDRVEVEQPKPTKRRAGRPKKVEEREKVHG